MRVRGGMIFALFAGLTLSGCAAGAAGGGGPLTSPTGREYPPGIEPSQTEQSQLATLMIAQGQYQEALAAAQEGIAADSTNAEHFYLAGEAAVGLGQYELADEMWVEAERLYPAYEIDIEPARESAWAESFNQGVEAYNAGDMEGAIDHWRRAHMIYNLRPEAAQNLAVVLTQEGRYQEAIDVYREGLEAMDIEPATRVIEEEELAERQQTGAEMEEALAELLLFTEQFAEAEELFRRQLTQNPDDVTLRANLANALTRQGRTDEAAQIYEELLTTPGLPVSQLFNIGVSLFQGEQHARAAEAFELVIEQQPNHRDSWFNLANALYAAEDWEGLADISDDLTAADPLNETIALILTRAFRELERNQEALAILERAEDLPVFMDEVQMRPEAERSVLMGTVVGNAAAAGDPVRLEFTFYDNSGALGTESVTVNAPAPEQNATFEVVFPQSATAYGYRVLN